MKKGKVLDVITLPDKVKIKTEQQIRDLASHQKVEVVFSPAEMNEVAIYFKIYWNHWKRKTIIFSKENSAIHLVLPVKYNILNY